MGDCDRCAYAVSSLYECQDKVRRLIDENKVRCQGFTISDARRMKKAIGATLKALHYLNAECEKRLPVEDLAREADIVFGCMDLDNVDWRMAQEWIRKVRTKVSMECMTMRPPRLAMEVIPDGRFTGDMDDLCQVCSPATRHRHERHERDL